MNYCSTTPFLHYSRKDFPNALSSSIAFSSLRFCRNKRWCGCLCFFSCCLKTRTNLDMMMKPLPYLTLSNFGSINAMLQNQKNTTCSCNLMLERWYVFCFLFFYPRIWLHFEIFMWFCTWCFWFDFILFFLFFLKKLRYLWGLKFSTILILVLSYLIHNEAQLETVTTLQFGHVIGYV